MILRIGSFVKPFSTGVNKNDNKSQSSKNNNIPISSYHFNGMRFADEISFGLNTKNIKNYNEDEIEFLKFRQRFSLVLHKKMVKSEEAGWNFFTNGSHENLKKYEESLDELNKLYQDEETYNYLKRLSSTNIKSPLLKKQLNSLLLSFELQNKFKDEIRELNEQQNYIKEKYNSYIHEIDGQKVTGAELKNILQTSKDKKLRNSASQSLANQGNFIAKDMIELIKKRNEFAKKLGYNNYFEYILKNSYNVDVNDVSKLFDELYSVTEDLSKKQKFNKSNSNPFVKIDKYIKKPNDMIDTVERIYSEMGWDINKVPLYIDLYPRKNKDSHWYCFDIDTNKDVRILANAANNTKSVKSLCHELGHGFYDFGISERVPLLNRCPASDVLTEAVALMFEHVAVNEDVFQEKLGIPKKLFEKLKDSDRKLKAEFVRSVIFYFDFEKSLYENPNQDIKKVWYELKEKYLKYKIPEKMDNEWCNVPHFLTHPGYYQNYLRADIIASQIYEAAVKKLGPLTKNKNTASYLNKKLFRTGSVYSEEELLKRFLGCGVNNEAFIKMLKGEN